jgi:hypothetical protein
MTRKVHHFLWTFVGLSLALVFTCDLSAQFKFDKVDPNVVEPGSILPVSIMGEALDKAHDGDWTVIYNNGIAESVKIKKLKVSDDFKKLTAEITASPNAPRGAYFVRATVAEKTYDQPITIGARTGEEARSIVGFEQAGASAANFDQKFFFDFYISRPMPMVGSVERPWLRWWGNVRIASVPQQINTPVAQFAADFINTVGKLPVNELAESAEFLTGLEVPVLGEGGFLAQSEDSKQRFSLGIFGGVGATGTPDPKSTVRVFEVPDKASDQFARFAQQFPSAASRKYVGFLSPDRDQFYRQYFVGFKLTTYYESLSGVPYSTPPAMVSVSFGRNELVTGGMMKGVVTRIEACYPLPLGDRNDRMSSIYLFGSAQMRLQKANPTVPFILNEAFVQDDKMNPVRVQASNSNVALVTTPSNRDIYKIGVGIDVLKLFGPKPKTPAGN